MLGMPNWGHLYKDCRRKKRSFYDDVPDAKSEDKDIQKTVFVSIRVEICHMKGDNYPCSNFLIVLVWLHHQVGAER